ncbi:MAG: hypothetical protein NVS4B7_15570 [Ktedonobacteraceae bacterium]
MEEQTSTQQSAMVSPAQTSDVQTQSAVTGQSIPDSAEIAAPEHRVAYGTAKTENLRDSGLWRIILPAFVAVLCLALLAVPLIILIPLLVNSLDPNAHTHNLTWLWITMIILEVGIAVGIIWGLAKIFMTQAGNYR